MGGLIVVAIIVILCFIIWKKNQGKNTPAAKKSIENREKPADEKLHKEEDLKNLEDSVKSFEVREEQKYDGSRKKDRGKKRREKRRAEAEEIKEAPATKIEDKKVEAKAGKVEKPVEKVEAKLEKPEEKTEAKVEKVEPKIEEAKAKVNEPVKKAEPKVENLEPKAEIKKETVKPVEKVEEKPEAKEKIDKPVEKPQPQKIISTNEKYSDIIKALSENPWDLASEKINIKVEDLKTKKPLDENYSVENLKKSLTRENLSEFLNMVKTNPTILKRKDNMTYEFTVKSADEIKKIAERYSLTSSNFEKASSVITVDKENFKLLEVTDILTDGEKRIYFETKF